MDMPFLERWIAISLGIGVFISVVPIFRQYLTAPVRLGASAALGLSSALTSGETNELNLLVHTLLCCGAGLSLGVSIAIVFEFIPLCLRALDVSRGAQLSEQLLPGAESAQTPLETLGGILSVIIFFESELSFQVFASLPKFSSEIATRVEPYIQDSVSLSAQVIERGLTVAIPAFVAALLLDCYAGFAGKGKGMVAMEIVPVKLLLGLLVLVPMTPHLLSGAVVLFESAL